MRTVVTAIATAVVCTMLFAETATTRPETTSKRIRLGETVHVPALDLYCNTNRRDQFLGAPSLYCMHDVNGGDSRAVIITRRRYSITDQQHTRIVYSARRNP